MASEVNVTWFIENPIRYNPGIGLPEFVIADIHHAYCDGTYMYAIMDKSYKIGRKPVHADRASADLSDRFSCLEGIIHLRRSIGYHVVQSFIPTVSVSCLSCRSLLGGLSYAPTHKPLRAHQLSQETKYDYVLHRSSNNRCTHNVP